MGARIWSLRGPGAGSTVVDFEVFYRENLDAAVRWASALVGSRAVGEELAHDSLLAVGDRIEGVDNPVGYLRRTVVNRAASWHRSQQREQRRWMRASAGQPTSYSSATNEVLDVLATLPYNERAAITLRFWADWSDDDIAAALECALPTVRVWVHRGLLALRKELS